MQSRWGRSELSLRLEGSETIGFTHLAPAAAGLIHLARAAAKVPLVSLARFTASLTRATGSAGPRPASTCPAVPGRGRLSSRNPGRPRAARRRRLLCHNCDSGVFAAGPRFGAIPRDLQALFSAHRDPRALVVRPTLAPRFARRLPARCNWPRTPAALCLAQGWQGRAGSLTSAPRPATPVETSAPRPATPSDPGLVRDSPGILHVTPQGDAHHKVCYRSSLHITPAI